MYYFRLSLRCPAHPKQSQNLNENSTLKNKNHKKHFNTKIIMNREMISVHVGQAGIQIGNSVWELLCAEHGINAAGGRDIVMYNEMDQSILSSMFKTGSQGKLTPRAFMIDMEPSVIDDVKTGVCGRLFSPANMIHGKEDASNNYARGYYTMGKEVAKLASDKIQHILEECDNPQGVFFFRSLAGGTGSGLGSRLIQTIRKNNKKMNIQEISVYPSPRLSCTVVEPYNTILTTHASLQGTNICYLFDNEACYKICLDRLKLDNPSYYSINRLISQTVAALTASLRFDSPLNVHLDELQTNLIPYPKLHFPLLAYAPLYPAGNRSYETTTAQSLVYGAFDPQNQFISGDPKYSKYMACCLLFRGHVSPNEAAQAAHKIRSEGKVKFVEYSPTGFKIGINEYLPLTLDKSGLPATQQNLVMASNNSSVAAAWDRILMKFYKLYSRRAFVHHFVGEGMHESDFKEALDNINSLTIDYLEMVK